MNYTIIRIFLLCLCAEFFLVACQKKNERYNSFADAQFADVFSELDATADDHAYSKKDEHGYVFKNGNIAGLRNVSGGVTELFFSATDGLDIVLETGAAWQYKIEYSVVDDVLWVLFSNPDMGRLFKISDTGSIRDEMTFKAATFPDVTRLSMKNGKPVGITFDCIEALSEYVVDLENHTITLMQIKNHTNNGYKP